MIIRIYNFSGVIQTEIWRNMPFPINFIWRATSRFYLKTLKEGIQTTIYCALAPELERVSGRYFRDCKEGTPHVDTHKLEWREALWEKSVKIVKLTQEDPKI